MEKFFPLSYGIRDTKKLIINILIYVLISVVVGAVSSIVTAVVGIIFKITFYSHILNLRDS